MGEISEQDCEAQNTSYIINHWDVIYSTRNRSIILE